MTTGDRFFRAKLANDISNEGALASPVLLCRGICVRGGGELRVNNVQVLGVDNRFWEMAPSPVSLDALDDGEVVLNHRLASRLGLSVGDEFLLRVEKTGAVPLDLPFVSSEDLSVAMMLKVGAIAAAAEFGDFSLRISQVAPLNVFLPLSVLSSRLDLQDRANLMIASGSDLDTKLSSSWTLADGGLSLTNLSGGEFMELKSSRIFMDSAVCEAALASGNGPQGVFSYFVNQLKARDRSTPYSFVASATGDFPHKPLRENEIAINEWLADDLGIAEGDALELHYYVVGPMRKLFEETAEFVVGSVVPVQPAHQSLIPVFPGLSNTESCQDWESSLPVDLGAIREKDEDYWNNYRGAPKAYVSLSAARLMWENRFGSLTAVRYPSHLNELEELQSEIRSRLDPASLGLQFFSIREEALGAANESVDFGQLFLGLSFFIIVSALILTGLLFVFEVENRREETAALVALGYKPTVIKRLLLAEGGAIAIAGGVLGSICGLLYNECLIHALGSVWRGAVGTSALYSHIRPATVLVGFLAATTVAVACASIAIRRQLDLTVSELHAGKGRSGIGLRRGRAGWLLLVASAFGVAGIVLFVPVGGGQAAAGAFFAAGALLLVFFLAAFSLLFRRIARNACDGRIDKRILALRGCARRRGRSLATVALLSCGIFLVIAVAANRQNPRGGSNLRSSGTGGFALYGETSLPVLHDLNSREGKEALPIAELIDLRFVQLRLREGDDASCLNLNRIESPRILGVNPTEFSSRRAFSFANVAKDVDVSKPWFSLEQTIDENTVPAVADQSVIAWGLGKAVGDTLSCVDDSGKAFKLKLVGGLANSIFQGSVIVSERAFRERFPSVSGSRVFLVDASEGQSPDLREKLTVAMEDVGLDVRAASDRLAEFGAITNTYLSIFLMLGGLGVILGTVGLGIVVMRNVFERRAELAIMRAVGFRRGEVFAALLREHALLLLSGVSCGSLAGLVGVLPAVVSAGREIPFGLLMGLLVIILINGGAWILIAAFFATRGDLLPALRSE